MKVSVKKEVAAFVLQGRSYNGAGEEVEVSYADLRAANIGDTWEAFSDDNCGRDVCEEYAEVVYKTEQGAAVLFRSRGTTDDPNPESWEDAPELVWYEFA